MKMVEKATLGERINHWALAVSFFVLFFTGFGFAFRSFGIFLDFFGGPHLAATIHEWFGVVFIFSVLFTIGSYLSEAMSFGPEDSEWIRLRGGYLEHGQEIPPQGRMNFGQKMFYLLVLGGGLLIGLSGFMIWLGTGGRGGMIFAHFLHNVIFFFMVVAVPVHIYLATAANPGVLRVMLRGTVPLEWARKHHGKWVKQLGL